MAIAVGMEEEMEARMVVEIVVEKVERVAGQGKQGGCVGCCWFAGRRKKKENERERKKGGVYI